jgi:hypothetical protein
MKLPSQNKMHLLFTFSYNLANVSRLDTGDNEFNSEYEVTLTPLCTLYIVFFIVFSLLRNDLRYVIGVNMNKFQRMTSFIQRTLLS